MRGRLLEPDATPLPAKEFTIAIVGDTFLQEKVVSIDADLCDDQFRVFLELVRVTDPTFEDGFDDGTLETTDFGSSFGCDATLNV